MKNIIDQIREAIKIKGISDLFKNSKDKNTEIYHSNYFIIFAIELFLFGCLSLYLYHSSKYFIEKMQPNIIFVPRGLKEKHELLLNLSKATFFRFISFLYIILFSNRTALDLISFINFIMHVLPNFIFLMSFYIYIGFLIEKFYELSFRRIYVLTSFKYILYFSFLLVILLSIAAIIFKIYKESYFFIDSVLCINYLIIGILYFIYGRKITSLMKEANNLRINNPLAMKNIRKMINSRIIPTCFIISPSYVIFGIIEGLVAIDFFGIYYPSFIDLNLLDGIIFFFCELLPSFIIGYTKKKWNTLRIEELCNPQSMEDFNDKSIRKGNVLIVDDNNKSLEEQMEEMLEKFEGEKNSDKFIL